MKEIRFGVIGLGLMGREFVSAASRWCHLLDMNVRPTITAICDNNPGAFGWFESSLGQSLLFKTTDYRELLQREDVDAVYCAVPHNLHEQVYVDIIEAGKHLLGEKPFGIDLEANRKINDAIALHPDQLVRCSSEMPFFPGAMRIVDAISEGHFGRIIEVEAGLLHSSDLNPQKPLNWKRIEKYNGRYGCMGDLGMHVVHIPLRCGWMPHDISARLSNLVVERPDGKGGVAPCETWDNATVTGEVRSDQGPFPITLHMKRIAPGEANTWFLKVHGMNTSMEFSTKYPKTLRLLEYLPGGPQAWQELDVGYDSAYEAITGEIFEFGFTDSILQMWAAYCDELANGKNGMKQPFTCVTPEEAAQSHEIFTQALAGFESRVG